MILKFTLNTKGSALLAVNFIKYVKIDRKTIQSRKQTRGFSDNKAISTIGHPKDVGNVPHYR